LEHYKTCNELPLKIFFTVAEKGDVTLLLKEESEVIDTAILIEAWENIIIEYGKLDNNQSIIDVLDKSDQMYTQGALYVEIKGMLIYLVGAEKPEYVERLAELGYNIDMSSRETMINTIKQGDARSNHISTRMQFLQKDIEKYSEGKKQTFDGAMAWISSNLGFEPREDLTVSRYVEYKKQIRERNKAKRSNNR